MTRDALRITARSLKKGDSSNLEGTRFSTQTTSEAVATVDAIRERVDAAAILALWAIFERFIFDHVVASATPLRGAVPPSFGALYLNKVTAEAEYWRFKEVIDLYLGWVDRDVIMRTKQIKDHRDWLVHQNPAKGTPPNVDPQTAFAILGAFMDTIEP